MYEAKTQKLGISILIGQKVTRSEAETRRARRKLGLRKTVAMARLISLLAGLSVASSADVPTVKLGEDWQKKDVLLPVVGAGTWEYNNSEAYNSLCMAFKLGYTMLDTANMYGNQVLIFEGFNLGIPPFQYMYM